MKLLNSIKHCRCWGENHWYSNLIAWSIENPFKTWWKARKYFKLPKIKISFSKSKWSFPYASKLRQGKILDINIHDVIWKDKYDSPRTERSPLIYICLFGKYSIWITPSITYKDEFNEKHNGNDYYWDYLLSYVYYTDSLKCYSTWTTDSDLYSTYGNYEDDEYIPLKRIIPVVAMSLNKKGIESLKKELYEKRRNS